MLREYPQIVWGNVMLLGWKMWLFITLVAVALAVIGFWTLVIVWSVLWLCNLLLMAAEDYFRRAQPFAGWIHLFVVVCLIVLVASWLSK